MNARAISLMVALVTSAGCKGDAPTTKTAAPSPPRLEEWEMALEAKERAIDLEGVIRLPFEKPGTPAGAAVDAGATAAGLAFAATVRRYTIDALRPLCPAGATGCVESDGPPKMPIVVLDEDAKRVSVFVLMAHFDNQEIVEVDKAFERLADELARASGSGYAVMSSIVNVKSQIGDKVRHEFSEGAAAAIEASAGEM